MGLEITPLFWFSVANVEGILLCSKRNKQKSKSQKY